VGTLAGLGGEKFGKTEKQGALKKRSKCKNLNDSGRRKKQNGEKIFAKQTADLRGGDQTCNLAQAKH